MTTEHLLTRYPELLVPGAGGDDDGLGQIRLVSVLTTFGFAVRSTAITSSATSSAPNRSACLRMESISSGPMMASAKPGKFSTSVVCMSAPPAVTEPSKTKGFSSARAE